MAESLERYNDILRTVTKEHTQQIDLVDLSKELPKDTAVFYDDVHFNYSGADKLTQILSSYFKQCIE